MGRRRSGQHAHVTLGARTARRRVAVESVLADHEEFVSARQLHSLATLQGVRVGLTTVYRALREMEERGRADVVLDESGERLYRMRAADGHQHYLICRSCGTSRAIDSSALEDWVERVGKDSDFAALEHLVQLSGVCAPCQDVTREDAPGWEDSADLG
ncbi:Fur family transcriptional regulator [Streptomyces triticirhizae]|uniref:Transcriptional repressor n=1 Tax=Streptomyces triticirhizae TaxID=2483353 RepID=A0A3M2MB09_9ACTN|nr:transcriptional repressor [Streptomyces triticirhizae]RMI46699.1 transcriptional repressor [Streptomyces triticirhizae]